MSREMQKDRNEALKQKILATAMQIGLEEGFDSLSVRKIINKMQYSTSIIYYHFKNKQEIIDALVKGEVEKFSDMIRSEIKKYGSTDVIEQIKNIFWKVTTLAVREPEKYNLVVLRKYSSRASAVPPWLGSISQGLIQAMEAGKVRIGNAEQMAFSIWSSFLGFHLMLSLQNDLTEKKVQELFQTQMELLLNGIVK